MNKKGFTLAELLGVIVVLGILLLLVVPNVINNIRNSKQSLYDAQINHIKLALQNWKEENPTLLPNDGEIIYLTIGQLKRLNYLENDVKDPKTEKMWPNDMLLTIQNDDGYKYNVLTNTGTVTELYNGATPSLSFDTGDVVILNIGDDYLEPVVTLNKSDGSKEILVDITKTISGSGNTVDTTYAGVFQVKYTLLYGGMSISSIHNVIVRDLSSDIDDTDFIAPDTTLYNDGTAVYFNPNTGEKCSSSEAVSTTNTKNGCMKWYTFGDKENETEIRLILDHNSTALVSYNSNDTNNTFQPQEAKTALTTDTLGWKKSIKSTARFITSDEIAHITEADSYLRFKNSLPRVSYQTTPVIGENTWAYYFDGKDSGNDYWKSTPAKNGVSSNFAWLYDYTYCGMTGCNIPDDTQYTYNGLTSNIYGYWTSSKVTNDSTIWVVYSYGQILEVNESSSSYGIRPVITIPKSLIK